MGLRSLRLDPKFQEVSALQCRDSGLYAASCVLRLIRIALLGNTQNRAWSFSPSQKLPKRDHAEPRQWPHPCPLGLQSLRLALSLHITSLPAHCISMALITILSDFAQLLGTSFVHVWMICTSMCSLKATID